MKKIHKVIIFLIILLVVIFLIYFNSKKTREENEQELLEQTRYFSPSLDKITIDAVDNILYINNPTTILNYYALDNSGNLVHFKQGDRAFVRILGITHLYSDNTEIFHPESADGSIDDTIFTGKITISEPGKFLIKVCIGTSINLNEEGKMIWPFGCFEDTTSDVIDVYNK